MCNHISAIFWQSDTIRFQQENNNPLVLINLHILILKAVGGHIAYLENVQLDNVKWT
jgi:hypothetical protein